MTLINNPKEKISAKILLVAFFAIILMGTVLAAPSTVSRDFSTTTPIQCTSLNISLDVYVNSTDTFYAIDETVPANWTISDPGTGDTSQSGHIKWVVMTGAESIVYNYTVTVPCNASGSNNFSGEFGFDDAITYPISGSSTVNVIEIVNYYCDNDADTYISSSINGTCGANNVPTACTLVAGNDCNDDNASIHPEATEICDNLDNDCDGTIDDFTQAASNVEGECENNTNTCSEGNWNPTEGNYAPTNETCNGLDDNCDGTIDEDVKIMFYADSDSDLFGNPDDSLLECSAPTNYVTNNTDNCPTIYNPEQTDSDADGIGDACENHLLINVVVFDDLNSNGIQNENETGIANVTVTHNGTNFTTNSNGLVSIYTETEGNHTVIETNPSGYDSTTPDTVIVSNTSFGNNYSISFGDQLSCVENWQCTAWSDSRSCGERTCTDLNSCETELSKPIETKECPSTGGSSSHNTGSSTINYCTDCAWSECQADGTRNYVCNIVNSCVTPHHEEETCTYEEPETETVTNSSTPEETNTTALVDNTTQSDNVKTTTGTQDNLTKENKGNGITGAVTGGGIGNYWWLITLLVLIAGFFTVFFIRRKNMRDD